MEGEQAMLWFHSWCQDNLEADWESFSPAIIRRFSDGDGIFVDLKQQSDSPMGFLEHSVEKVEMEIPCLPSSILVMISWI